MRAERCIQAHPGWIRASPVAACGLSFACLPVQPSELGNSRERTGPQGVSRRERLPGGWLHVPMGRDFLWVLHALEEDLSEVSLPQNILMGGVPAKTLDAGGG